MLRYPRFSLATLAVAAALAGCTVGPDFRRPAAPDEAGYLSPGEAAYLAPVDTESARAGPGIVLGAGPGPRWWTAFNSPPLNELVDGAIAHNASLEASNATLAAVRDEVDAARGRQLPQVDVNARIEREQVNLAAYGFNTGGGNPEFNLYSVGGGISYDLDLFGANRRRVEQVSAQAEAQLHQTEAAHLTLAGQVVNQVLLIAAVRARVATADTLLAEDRRNVELAQKRQRAGEGTLVEVLNAQAQYENDHGDVPQLSQQLAEARHLLATLTGMAPSTLGTTDFALDQLSLPAQVPVTLPSELVHKRPDILQAEARLHAASASVGIATAQLYPNITLGASLAQGSPNLGDLLSSSFRGFDVFGGLTAPLFHGGTLKAQQQVAIEQARAADATYRQTVLDAFRQVADLLAAIDNDARSVAGQREAVTVAQRSLYLSRRSFQVGNSGIVQVLDSERLYQRAVSSLVEARARQILNVARLYVATGGGWTESTP